MSHEGAIELHSTVKVRQELLLFWREIAMPAVDDEHDAPSVARVHDFVFDRIVQDQATARLPGSPGVAGANSRALRCDDRQVIAKPQVGGSTVRRDARVRIQDREIDATPDAIR